LYQALASLPEEFVHTEGTIYRAEKGFRFNIDEGDGKPLEKGDTIPFWSFKSFTKDPAMANPFKTTSALTASADPATELIGASQEFTLAERVRQFWRNFACDTHLHGWQKAGACDGLAKKYEDNVTQLNEKLQNRFQKKLPERGEKQKRTIIKVKDGVGYDIALFSDFPGESEIMVEGGTQLEVLENSLRMWGELGEEEDSSRQYLTTRMLRIDPLLTGEPVSPVRRHVDAVVKDSQQIDALAALLREKRRGGCPSNLSPEILSQLQKIGKLIAQSPSTSKGGLVTRSATRGGRGLPDVRGLVMSEDQKAQTLIKQLWEEAHDFEGASDWLLQVTVKQHDGKDDEVGERIDASKVQTAKDLRRYFVDAGKLLKVTVRNLSLVRTISFCPVYVDDAGNDDPEDPRMLKKGESEELPYALEKDSGEKEDGWDLRDGKGTKTLLRLRFALISTYRDRAPPT
jgi:hypothetical protein